MKAAAAQVGIDPVLIERATRLLAQHTAATPSFLERLVGGPVRHRGETEYPVVMDEPDFAQLMSAIRIGVGQPGEGHSSALGLTWQSSDYGGSVLRLKAEKDTERTIMTADLDRRGTLAVVASGSAVAGVMAFLFGGTLASELVPGYGLVGGLLGLGGVAAVARSYWSASTRTARDRLSEVMERLNRFIPPSNTA
jgi:hypothetical protein